MKKILKRIQFIHRTNDGIYRKFWQFIDFKNMITIEHVWKDLNQQLVLLSLNKKYKFYYYKTKQLLPDWYHVDLLNDNEQILIEEIIESVPFDKPLKSSTPIKTVCFKNTSKKKQLKTYITNRSFIITNKYSIPNTFYQQWEEGKLHKNTNNCQIIF